MANNFEVNDVLEARMEGVVSPAGTRWNMVWHYRVDENLDEDLTATAWLQALADILSADWASSWLPHVSNQLRYDLLRLKRIAPEQSVFVVSTTGAGVGGETGEIDQPDAAIVLTWRTDKPGPRFRGRSYLPGVPDAHIEEGIYLSTEADTLYAAIITGLNQVSVTDICSVTRVHWSAVEYADSSNIEEAAPAILSLEIDRIVRRQSRRDYKGRIPSSGA